MQKQWHEALERVQKEITEAQEDWVKQCKEYALTKEEQQKLEDMDTFNVQYASVPTAVYSGVRRPFGSAVVAHAARAGGDGAHD